MKDSKVAGGTVDRHGRTGEAVLVSSSSLRKREACSTLLAAADPSGSTVLDVSLTHPVDERVVRWTETIDATPDRITFLTADRSEAAARSVLDRADLDAETEVDPVGVPTDLSGLELAVSRRLNEWPDDRRVLACFDSVTTLLQYADRDRAFALLSDIADRFRSAEGTAFVHVDPAAHDDETLADLREPFDAVATETNGAIEIVDDPSC